MRAKRAIHYADKAHKDNQNRARDLAALGASLSDAFKEKSYLDREDLKKLEKAEKLTKSIRDAFGGSTEEELIENPPANLAEAMTQLVHLTESLKDRVEKTPKRVVSAAVIDEANVLLELIRIVQRMQRKT
jgi:cob(I)alamin adenosyltransferase